MGPVQTWIEHLFLRHAVKPCGATLSCSACRTGARLPALCTPAALGRPGQSIPALPVRRANPFGCALPASLGRSPGPASTGRSPDSGSPRGALENLRLTRGEPGRPGKVPLALFYPRPHPCRLGASTPACNGLRNKCSSCTGLWSELMGQCLPWFFQFTKQKARFLLCSTRPLTLRRSPVTQQPVL